MVNYGVSRACKACKQRHKKCDEIRPTCSRCTNAKRTCVYEFGTDGELIFRHTNSSTATQPHPSPPKDNSSDDGAPKRRTKANGGLLYPNVLKPHISEDALILADFIHNFSFIPQDLQLSRGYLSALPAILNSVDDESNVTKAALIAAFASAGKRQNRPDLLKRAEKLYISILGSFRQAIASMTKSTCIATFLTSVLLGLYEIVTATVGSPGAHNSHLKGLGAILALAGPPFNLLGSIHFFAMANAPYMTVPTHISKHMSEPEDLDMKDLSITQDRPPGEAVSVPFTNSSVQSMADLIVEMNAVMTRSEEILSLTFEDISAVRQYFDDLIKLECEFERWASSQRGEWQPRLVMYTSESSSTRFSDAIDIWPGAIKSFYDIYVASVWNTCWKCHILVLNVLTQCAQKLQDLLAGTTKSSNDKQEEWRQKANNIADDVFASVPFHLTRLNEIEFDASAKLDEQPVESSLNEVGRVVGGLLLMHPVYVVMQKPIVSEAHKAYARKILRWIGTEMGIGEATALADETCKVPFPYAAKGHVLIWAGMLISVSDDKFKWSLLEEVMESGGGPREDQVQIKCECKDDDKLSSWRH